MQLRLRQAHPHSLQEALQTVLELEAHYLASLPKSERSNLQG